MIGSHTVFDDIKRTWAGISRKKDPAMLSIETNIRKKKSKGQYVWALKDINFEVHKGNVLGIIGKNGAGKSTLLKILSRITSPTTGTAKIKGRIASLLEIGTGFHPELTGRENIYLNGAILGMTKREIDQKLDEIIDFSGIERYIDTPVKRYSSGMYVRLAFAVAAHLEPEILLVDEVLAVGDFTFQDKCLGKMRDVSKEGRTVLFVSHNLHAVRKLCRSAILLEDGMMVKEGEVNEVLSNYMKNTYIETPTVDLPPAENNDPIFGKRLHFFNKKGSPSNVFRTREKWLATLEFELTESLPHVVAAIGPVTSEGVTISAIWSKPKDLHPGIYCVNYEIELPLAACQLSFIVGLSSMGNTIYYKENIGSVTITEISEGQQPEYSPKGNGLFITDNQPEIIFDKNLIK